MQIDFGEKDGISIFKITGDIDINTSPDVKKSFDEAIKKNVTKVIIDLSNVNYVDSSGLATLVEVLKNVRANSGKLKITNLSDKVRGLFEITKLDKLFDIKGSEEEAINSFN